MKGGFSDEDTGRSFLDDQLEKGQSVSIHKLTYRLDGVQWTMTSRSHLLIASQKSSPSCYDDSDCCYFSVTTIVPHNYWKLFYGNC